MFRFLTKVKIPKNKLKLRITKRKCSNNNITKDGLNISNNNHSKGPFERYPRSMSIMHWAVATGILSCFGLVEIAKRTDKKNPLKGTLMYYHKSIGLLVFGLAIGRLGLRFTSKLPGMIPGTPTIQHYAAMTTHYSLLSMMIFMPVTGILMGYFGGKGLPFFLFRIPGASGDNKKPSLAKSSYIWHKRVGKVFEIAVGLHISGTCLHILQGQNILTRVSPFVAGGVFLDYIDINDYDYHILGDESNESNQKELKILN